MGTENNSRGIIENKNKLLTRVRKRVKLRRSLILGPGKGGMNVRRREVLGLMMGLIFPQRKKEVSVLVKKKWTLVAVRVVGNTKEVKRIQFDEIDELVNYVNEEKKRAAR